MSYMVVAIGCGLLLGIVVAAGKHFLIWRPFAKGRGDNIYGPMAFSMAVNILIFVTVYLLRGYWPYSFSATIVGLAVGLSAGSHIFSIRAARR